MIASHQSSRCGVRLFADSALLLGSAMLAMAMVRPASAQITIDPSTATGVYVAGAARSGHTSDPVKNAGGTISYFYTNSWIEIPFTVESAGMYDLTLPVASTVQNLKAQIHVQSAAGGQLWASDDIALPTTGDWGAFADATVTGIPILQPGAHLLRVANVKLQHHTAADREPGFENDPGENGPGTGTPRDTGFNFGIMTLTRTGDLPAIGTISGTISSGQLGGIAVADAYVMAVGQTTSVEAGPIWQRGFWTRTAANGAYVLTVPAGATYDVVVGQPSMYAFEGARQSVSVVAGQTHTVNPDLSSRWAKTEDGKLTVQVEPEFFIAKNPDAFSTSPGAYDPSPVVHQGRPIASNGINVGYVDIGNTIDVPVDVPKGHGGDFTVIDLYFNGYWDGASYFDAMTRIVANPGGPDASTVEATEPNTTPKGEFGEWLGRPDTGYSVRGSVTYQDPIRLKEGHNVLRIEAMGIVGQNASSAWDAIVLTEVNIPVPAASAARALKVAAGLEALAPTDLPALNADNSGISQDVVDLHDAIALARQGKL